MQPQDAKAGDGLFDRIEAFLREDVLLDPQADLLPDTPLAQGLIDSMGLLVLIAFVEEEFDVELDPADITLANFATIADIARLVEARGARDR
jgi:acyl carrier protein